MKFIYLLLIVLVIGVNGLFKIPLHHVPSPRHEAIKNANLTEFQRIREQRKIKLSTTHSSKGLNLAKSQGLRDYDDFEYLGIVSVGSPPQSFRVVMDTGSSNFWLTDQECSDKPFLCKEFCKDETLCEAFAYDLCCPRNIPHVKIGDRVDTCKNQKKFNSKASSSFKTTGKQFFVQYGTGESSGKVGLDTLVFGDVSDNALVVKNVEIGRTTFLGYFFRNKREISGILGLAFRTISNSDMNPPFIKAYEENLVNSVFTVYMKKNGYRQDTAGGQITFGGLDTQNCGSLIDYVPLSRAMYWQFYVSSLTINNGVVFQQGYEVISDTGTSFLALPYPIFYKIVKEANARLKGGLYYVTCGTKLELKLTIHGKSYTMTQEQLYVQDRNGDCILAIDGSDMELWILGDPWLRSYCNVHDMQNQRIGFAKPKK